MTKSKYIEAAGWESNNTIPNSDVWIEVVGSDARGEYSLFGKFINYKKPPTPRKIRRFVVDGVNEDSQWRTRERWRYVLPDVAVELDKKKF